MKRKFMKAMSLVLSTCMVISAIPPASAANVNSPSEANNSVNSEINNVSVSGTNSFGKMFSETYYEDYSQQEATGYGIYSVEFTDNVAEVKFDTLQTATIVVGLYEENNHSDMIMSEEIEVSKEDTSTEITFNSDEMPEYFYVKAYLVDSETFRPLSKEYTSPMYTSDMQYLEGLSTTDFPEEQVLNLDDDTENNFAIYNSSVKVVPESGETNVVKTVDDTNGTYVFENIDDSISSLQAGDTFAYAYGDDGLIIARVSKITIDGTTATINSTDLEMEEVFDYVKIDVEPNISEAEIGTEELPEGVEYNGLIGDSTVTSRGVVSSGGSGLAPSGKLSFGLNDVSANKIYSDLTGKELPDNTPLKYININGGVNLEITPGVEFKLTSDNKYFEFKIDYSIGFDISFSATKDIVSSTAPEGPEDTQPFFVISFGYIKFTHISGVSIKITPGLALSVGGELSISGTLSGTVGFRVSNSGFENITTNPNLEFEIAIEATIFIGIDLNPEVSFLENLASAELEGVLGVEASASMSLCSAGTSEALCLEPSVHDCSRCIDGDLVGKFNLSFSADILDIDFLKVEVNLLDIEFKISDFYYSFDHKSFGFCECPFQKHRVTVNVVDSSGEPIELAHITAKDSNGELVEISDVNDYQLTDKKGKVSFYLLPGEYKISASDDIGKYKEATKNLAVIDDAKSTYINLLTHDEILDDYYNQNSSTPSKLSLGGGHSACVTENGDLYIWGSNGNGQLGNGTTVNQSTPQKILSYVKMVSLGMFHSAAITENGDLYMWGGNGYGQLGNGTTIDQNTPQKILSDVKMVSLGYYHSAAITENGDLYMWGHNSNGQLGNGTTVNQSTPQSTPQKILGDVEMVSLGASHSAAITENGDLYMWGVIGGNYGYTYQPKFITSNVKYVSLGNGHSAYITENGDLYTWGTNSCGQLGNGTTKYGYLPELIMGNVKQINLGPAHSSAAITEDGELYMWGWKLLGQLGDGSNEDLLTPTKITAIPDKVKEIALGFGYTGAITENGDIYTWGDNRTGQLGDGTTIWKNTPTKITLPTETSKANSNSGLIFSSTPNTKTVAESGAGSNSTKSFEGLMPNETYNFYAMKSKNASEPLSSENLLYISQAISDENGALNIEYNMTKDYKNAVFFVVPMKQTDLSNATVTMDNLEYNGEEQFIHPTVTLDDITLVEGTDYELCNYYYAQNIGEYKVTIKGIGYYTGEIDFTYYVNGKLGDINLDGNITVVDAILVLKHIINDETLNSQEQSYADVNKDGEISVIDAIMIQRAIINLTAL